MYSIINSTTRLRTAQLPYIEWSHCRILSKNSKVRTTSVQYSKQFHRKELLSSFHLNGPTLGFHPQTQKLEPPCTA